MQKRLVLLYALIVAGLGGLTAQSADHLVFEGTSGPGKGKHVVLLAGDEEYRSEEAMPLMGQLLAKQGFKCTVLFSLDDNGIVDPKNQKSLSNPSALDSADAIVMSLRFRNWPDATFQKFDNALRRGIPIIALRTSTHAFKVSGGKWAKYSFNAKPDTGWTKGFGRHVLGETWVSHHGKHKVEGTRSVVEAANKGHEILNGVGEIFGTTDVYGANPPKDANILLRGQVTQTLDPKSGPVAGKKNDPMQPILWTRLYKNDGGKTNRIVTTTMGAATDLLDEDLRRAVANSVFWGLKLPVPAKVDVTVGADYKPEKYSFGGNKKNKKPADFIIKSISVGGGAASVAPAAAAKPAPTALTVTPNSRIVLMGGGLASRMANFGNFETAMHVRYPGHKLYIRNIADEGNTPSFRPHSGRKDQLGFPGADKFYGPYAHGRTTDGIGHFETDEQWLNRLKPDVIIASFGFTESFLGVGHLDHYRTELDAFLKHTLSQKYNGKSAPQLALVAPTAYQDVTHIVDVPNGEQENANLEAVTAVMKEVAAANGVLFVDAFAASQDWYAAAGKTALTSDGALLNAAGYAAFAKTLADGVFGKAPAKAAQHQAKIQAQVEDKNWLWINHYKIPNGVHVFGRRYKPYGPANYPFELKKIEEMTDVRDQAIWAAANGKSIDIAALDAKTSPLPEVKTNYNPGNKKAGTLKFLAGETARAKLAVPEGYKIEQFATEKEFPNLANPVQMSFDNKGRLWIATMPSYPHWRPGDPRPDDKLIILEDTNGDGKADKETVFADKLHVPMGFEFAPEGVYVTQGIHLVLLKDTNNDDKADVREIVFSGFDDHDTHHGIGAYCADPSGAFILCEGVFLRSNIETPYGTVRGTNGGFFRFAPQRRHLERHAQLSIPNPWGVAYDDWGQHFFLHTSGPTTNWMLPGSVKPRYGVATPGSKGLLEGAHRVRPTSGIEFVSSSHFPAEVQGDMLICNNIGFLGTKQHQVMEDGTGYTTKHRQDLIKSSDGNFRPVDLEFAPDGSLYVVDWHNPLIGHMQHNARDPNRDHAHGRVYRITYPGRPLVKPAKIVGASIEQLLDNLKLPEYRTRYRTRRELRGRDVDAVYAATQKWVAALDKNGKNYEHNRLEALWVTWGINKVDQDLLRSVLKSPDHRARAAATRVVRYTGHQVSDQTELLKAAAQDPHGRVKLEAITAASWLVKDDGLTVLAAAANQKAPEKKETAEKKPEYVTHGAGSTISIKHPATKSNKISSFTMTVPRKEQINLAEMAIYSGGKNIAKQAKISLSSTMGNYKPALLVDGNKDNFAHTNPQKNPWVKVELAQPTVIDEVKIWNRKGFEGRFNNAQIAFNSGKKKVANISVKIKGGSSSNNLPEGLRDEWIAKPYQTALAHLNDASVPEPAKKAPKTKLKGAAKKLFLHGAEIYEREGYCGTCHQPDGKGLPPAGFPPLAGTKWATGSEDRIIKLTLNGLMGPIEVQGKKYPGLVPMTGFGGMLNDHDIAAVLTFVRNSFGNKASVITPEKVKAVRAASKSKVGFYKPDELLKMHPHGK